ncbi:MAG TPA: putative aminohydrolase SsnA [Anaerolineales bacterium]|nr:putative aminohydrolase SsnA [Anaerolineales bacterium]
MLIINGKIITWGEPNQILEGQAIRIEADRIAEIGSQDQLQSRNPNLDRIDARGQYVMPGNICAHTHFYGAYARGLAIPGPAPKDFPEILQKLWWPLDKSLGMGDVRASADVMLVDAIKHGTTTLIDHHASPNALDGSLDEIADAVDTAGLRSVLCYEVTDRDGNAKAKAGIQENVRFQERLNAGDFSGHRLAGTFGLHASLTLSDETLEACRAAVPAGEGFHIHVAEHEVDEYDSLGKSGMRVVDRLSKHGILGPKTIVAHVVHIDIKEAELLADTNTWVTHQPRSNMNNGVGVAPIEDLLRAGINVGIGTDGFSHTMWEEWKTAYLLHKVWHRDPRRFSGLDAVQLGVYNNSALANKFFPEAALGRLTPGAFADIIFVDYHPHTPMTEGNLPWQIIFGFNEGMVTTTIVAGEVLMRDRKLLTLDEEAITSNARQHAPEVWKRYNNYVPN